MPRIISTIVTARDDGLHLSRVYEGGRVEDVPLAHERVVLRHHPDRGVVETMLEPAIAPLVEQSSPLIGRGFALDLDPPPPFPPADVEAAFQRVYGVPVPTR